MASGAGKNDENAEHDRGIGRIRERTIVIGDTLIAIDNIGSIQILDVKRNWGLARLGFFVAVGGIAVIMLLNNPYSYRSSEASPNQIIGMMLIGIGLAMIIANAMQPRRKGLGIGTGDGRISYVISESQTFLHQLLEFLTLKINTRDEGLTASFDITHNTFNTFDTNGGAVAIGANASATGVDNSISSDGGGLVIGDGGIASGSGGHALGANGSVSVTSNAAPSIAVAQPPPPAPAPAPQPKPEPVAEGAVDPDDALFADDPPPAPVPVRPAPAAPPPSPQAAPPAPVRTVAAARTRLHDPLLDGPKPGAQGEDDKDWLGPSGGHVVYHPTNEGGGARWLLPMAVMLLLVGGGCAGWYFYSQSQASTSVSLIPAQQETAPKSLAIPVAQAPADVTPDAAPGADALPTSTEALTPPAAEAVAPADVVLPQQPVTTPAPSVIAEPTSFSPPEPIVARASGLRYRASPSAASDVQIIAETRAGGEALLVNARLTQPDGEWYRVAMPDGRAAWFKASLTVPRSRFAETFATGAAPASFAAAAPHILEPAEGVQISGGPQPVRLAWDGPADASIYIVEIEAYDAVTKRWIEDPLHKRVTIESMDELAESIPRTGAWRWRVRGVSPAGEQSQFSRWSAFTIRD